MQLKAFIEQFAPLGDEFLTHFPRPFVLEEGLLDLGDDEDEEDEGAPGESRQVYYLQGDAGQALVVGRGEDCQVRIANRNASTRHAQLIPPAKPDQPWLIEDLGSTNGTFVNGVAVEKGARVPLNDEAVIGLGPVLSLVFLQPQTFFVLLRQLAKKQGVAARPGLKPGGETDVAGKAVALPDVSGSADEAGAAGPLTLHCDPLAPIPLAVGQLLGIGRSNLNAEIVLPHPQVSRRHAEIEVRADGVYARDLKSANGTMIGARRLGTDFEKLPLGVALRIADFRLMVRGPQRKLTQAELGNTLVVPAEQKRNLIRGTFEKIPVSDLLIGIEEKQKSGKIRINGMRVGGEIVFRAGRPCAASTNDGRKGAEAIRALLTVESNGRFALDPTPPENDVQPLERRFSELVLEDFLDA